MQEDSTFDSNSAYVGRLNSANRLNANLDKLVNDADLMLLPDTDYQQSLFGDESLADDLDEDEIPKEDALSKLAVSIEEIQKIVAKVEMIIGREEHSLF
jgi:hypothetical protein